MSSTEEAKPGQKFPTPTPGFGDRVFYETLLRQRPTSAMAQEWCLAYGVLSKKKSAKLLRIVTERKKNQRQGGMLSPSSSISPKKKKPKIVREEGVDPDLQTSGTERVTSATL